MPNTKPAVMVISLFLPQSGRIYRLCYGANKAEPPIYDTQSITELLHRGYPAITASLGQETETPSIKNQLDIGKLLNRN